MNSHLHCPHALPRRLMLAFVAITMAAGCSKSTSGAPDSGGLEADAQTAQPDADEPAQFVCPDRPDQFQGTVERSVRVSPRDLAPVDMSYVEAGSGGPTFVLLHGIPTSSYLWRNVIPGLQKNGRVIAPDLVGFGKSERPAAALTFVEHAAYLGAFLEALSIVDPILVLHDLGSAAGLVWASQNPGDLAGLVLMEAIIPPVVPAHLADSPSGCTSAQPDAPVCFWLFLRSPAGQEAIINQRFFIDSALAGDPFCPPTPAALAAYAKPFPTSDSWKFVAPLPGEVPVDGEPASFLPTFQAIADFLHTSEVPKLILYAEPGFLIPPAIARIAEETLLNSEAQLLGPGLHFLQETHPRRIAQMIAKWQHRVIPEATP